jgi:hypothetical protein
MMGSGSKKPGRTKKKVKKNTKRRSTQAPGQFYGYSIQTTRMVARLLGCSHGQAVSLEVLDDIAVTGGTSVIAEQSKSGLAHNPVTDRSVDLWKTLFNWVGAIRSGALTTETKFVLYVAQVYTGDIIEKLHAVRRPDDAHQVIAELRDLFWGPAPQRSEKTALPATLEPYVNGVLEASDDVLSRLFASLEFQTGTGSPVDDLTPLLTAKAIGEGAVEEVLKSILGWTKRRVENLIEKGKHPIITWEEFNRQLVAAARKFDRSDLLTPTPIEISESEVEQELQNRWYIQQLRWINCDDPDLVRAVNDYLRSSIDRTTWSERGDVLEASFEEFSDRLERYWDNKRRLVGIELADRPDVQLGQAVLSHCLSVMVQLQGLEVPSYFVPGSYHALADAFTIGWHPHFRELRGRANDSSVAAEDVDADVGGDEP